MSKGNINLWLCIDGFIIHEKDTNAVTIHYDALDFIKIIKSKRKVEEVLNTI